jgi:hypothetical protein
MSHPLILALFDDAARAAQAARALRALGLSREQVSIVTRSHDEEGDLADASGASPGSEIEDSRPAARLGELAAHVFAAVAVVLPGIGPIVADGPLAAGFGEAAGHVAGGIARTLVSAGVSEAEADAWQQRIERGDILVGAHVTDGRVDEARHVFESSGAVALAQGTWRS